jgi:heat shock protein HslJ
MSTRITTGRFAPAFFVFACALVLAGCSDEVTGPSDLQGGQWRLQSMETEEGRFVPDDSSLFTVQFAADGTVGVRADCNQCGGSYTLNGDTLTVGPLVCTLIACPTARGQQFATLLDGTGEVEIEDDRELEIESSEGTLILTR